MPTAADVHKQPEQPGAEPGRRPGPPADDGRVHLAAALSRLRAAAGLTLDTLAEASGVSRAFISQIESAKANPTLSTLDRLAAALGARAADLLADGTGRGMFEPVVRPARPVGDWPIDSGRTYPLSALEAGRFAVHLIDGAPADHDLWVEHVGEEFCMVVAGSYRIDIGDRQLALGEGSSVHFPSVLPHRIAPQSPKGRVLIVFAPAEPG